MLVGKTRRNLPVEVEGESFAPDSASGREFESHYLKPLGLTRADVLVTDMPREHDGFGQRGPVHGQQRERVRS